MHLLKELHDEDFGFETKKVDLKLREAVRVVVVNEGGQIAVLYVAQKNFYKIPGGGIEAGENKEVALRREVSEEAGCRIEIIKELGELVEYRTHFDQLQRSYCYLAKVVGDIGSPHFTDDELADGFETKWVEIDRAVELIKGVSTDDYMGKFVTNRELTILQEAQKHL